MTPEVANSAIENENPPVSPETQAPPPPSPPQTNEEYIASLDSKEAVEQAMADVHAAIAGNEAHTATLKITLDRLISRHNFFHRQQK